MDAPLPPEPSNSAQNQPDPPARSLTDVARVWLSQYEKCVRHRNYEGAKNLFHRNARSFGLECDYAESPEVLSAQEWEKTWSGQLSFTFDIGNADLIPDAGLILVLVPWIYSGLIKGAPRHQGRATIVLARFEKDKVLCVHMHLSRNVKTILTPPV